MQRTNNERLQHIASAMQELNERLVYVGGAVAGAYATDPAATEPRTTIDVDCVVDSNSYAEHAAFEQLLREKHFQNDHDSEPPVICRWVYNGEMVDVMSMNEQSLSFGNRWYELGFAHRELYALPSGQEIYRLPVTYYVATKIDALLSRGGSDWRGANDFEDIVYVLNYCTEFVDKFNAETGQVKSYLAQQFATMLKRPNLTEEIECAITPEEIERTDLILDILQSVASYQAQMLKIQFVSDVHLAFPQNRQYLQDHPLQVTGDILLIAGDSAYLDLPDSDLDTYGSYSFWDWASRHYQQVIVCLGNHDFYAHYDLSTMPDGYCRQIRHNVHAYYNSVVSIGDIDIIISTLWSKIEPCDAFLTEHNVSDFYRIKYNGHRLTAEDFNREHARCLQFIQQAVVESKAKTKIVLTHHVPTHLCTAQEFCGSTISGAFTVELGEYIVDSGIDYWIYGHSHRNIDAQISGTRILSNQLGYISHGEHQHNGFDPARHIDI
jgi:predicted phosphodiesterase